MPKAKLPQQQRSKPGRSKPKPSSREAAARGSARTRAQPRTQARARTQASAPARDRTGREPGVDSGPPIQLTRNALIVLEKRYLRRDDEGRLVETPRELFARVARAIAAREKKDRGRWERRFFEMMASLRFLPNSPTLMNAGVRGGQLSACFVLPVEDSLDSVFETLKHAARIHQSGGGTGFSFSRLRASGSRVRSTHGVASGPVSFIRVYDAATETIKQGGTRRGANMAVLRADHPDILSFVDSKRDRASIANFNISVGATSEFMDALTRSGADGGAGVAAGAGTGVGVGTGKADFALRDPQTGREVRRISARELFARIAQAAWESGDPGLVFLERINRFNPTPRLGEMESTNPCGEQPLLAFESCNLGSLNLGAFYSNGGFDWNRLREDVRVAVRFLDNVIDLNSYPVAECARITRQNRKIGLGVMGFADLLLTMGLPYDSEEARTLGERIMAFIDREAKHASRDLARAKGGFPSWKGSLWAKLGYAPMRNSTVTTVAPTGTISVIAGCSSGIEPIFGAVFRRNVLDGEQLIEVHPAVARVCEEKGLSSEQISGMSDPELQRLLGPAWSPAHRVSVEAHVRMQSVFQRFSDSGVSKTVNLPETATPEDVAKAYLLAYRLGCKGITVYRDRSKPAQVLEMCPSC